jgi:hypothetical protein
MIHPLVTQLRFARREFTRGLAGAPAEDARRKLGPMNCLSWIVAHLASQEQRWWVEMAQGRTSVPGLHDIAGWGSEPNTPDWEEVWAMWRQVGEAADDYLGTVSEETLDEHLLVDGQRSRESVGTMLLRNIYHYWFHLGEGHAVRQMLGHGILPQFVGDMKGVRYRTE